CLKSHPFTSLGRQMAHPSLHCRALELCFNVALNRLPTNPNPLFQTQPSLSNALVALSRRAQAHRRGGEGAWSSSRASRTNLHDSIFILQQRLLHLGLGC
ncbi:unnamed protein product, partial [Brassica napus]